MKFTTFSSFAALAVSSALAAEVTIQVGNPTAPTDPQKFQFSPRVTRINPGDTVKFVFNGNHTVTQQSVLNNCAPGAPAGATPFDSGVMVKGSTFDLPASAITPGSTIVYYCKIKEGAHCRSPNFMQGAIVVTGSATEGGAVGSNATVAATAGTTAGTAATATTTGKTITVEVGKDGKNQYSPSLINASPGDSITFNWVGGTHNVVPSDAAGSCTKSATADTDPIMKLLASGPPQSSGQHIFQVPATAAIGSKLWFYCSVGTHCSVGKMFGTINVVAPGTAVDVTPATTATTAAGGAAGGKSGGNSAAPAGGDATTDANASGNSAEATSSATTVTTSTGIVSFAAAVLAVSMMA